MLPQPARLDGLPERGHSADRRQPADLEWTNIVDEYTLAGKLVWTVHLSIVGYPVRPAAGRLGHVPPSPITPRRGRWSSSTPHGEILYRYNQSSGAGRLDHPSLAELLPSGVIMANDDHNDRMVAIDPSTGALVWQYGITGKPGTEPGQLNIPDGFDLLLPTDRRPPTRRPVSAQGRSSFSLGRRHERGFGRLPGSAKVRLGVSSGAGSRLGRLEKAQDQKSWFLAQFLVVLGMMFAHCLGRDRLDDFPIRNPASVAAVHSADSGSRQKCTGWSPDGIRQMSVSRVAWK